MNCPFKVISKHLSRVQVRTLTRPGLDLRVCFRSLSCRRTQVHFRSQTWPDILLSDIYNSGINSIYHIKFSRSCTTPNLFSVTPDFVILYPSFSVITCFLRSTKTKRTCFWPSLNFSINTQSKPLSMNLHCCSLIIISFLSLASTTLFHIFSFQLYHQLYPSSLFFKTYTSSLIPHSCNAHSVY